MATNYPPSMTFVQALDAGYVGRVQCRPYLNWIKTLPCHRCNAAPPSDPSHINTKKGPGTKSPDFFALPECRADHEAYEDLPRREGRAALDAENQRRMAKVPFYLMQAIIEGRLKWGAAARA